MLQPVLKSERKRTRRRQLRANAVDVHPDYIKLWVSGSTIIAKPTWFATLAFQDRIIASLEQLTEKGIGGGEIRRGLGVTMSAHLTMGSGQVIAQMKFRHRDDGWVENSIASLIERALFDSSDR